MTDDELPTVCILAGGLGTRLGELTRETPKPLVEVAGEPFLAHQLRLLAHHGARRVVLCVGYRGELIERRIGHEADGVEIAYSYDAPGLDGTLGAVRRALPLLGERFLVLYGDTYLRVDYRAVARGWLESGKPALMTVLHNEGRWDRSNVIFRDGEVERYDKFTTTPEMLWIDYGLLGLEAQLLDDFDGTERDLAVLFRELASRRLIFGYEATERFFEIGTPSALGETERFLRGEHRS
jgi:NDP-sugar pyrophosphorylase family protein